MGVSRKRLGVPGEKDLLGKGVSYCVDCDANFFKGERLAIVGNESAAVSGALTLLFYASEVHLIAVKLQVSERLQQQIEASDVIIHEGRKVKEIVGVDAVTGIVLDNDERLAVNGVLLKKRPKAPLNWPPRWVSP